MFLAPAPVKITPEMARAFDAKMKIAEAAEPARAAAMSALLQAEHNTNREKVGTEPLGPWVALSHDMRALSGAAVT